VTGASGPVLLHGALIPEYECDGELIEPPLTQNLGQLWWRSFNSTGVSKSSLAW